MKTQPLPFDEHEVLHELKHFLPAQAPLKDFVHHNTLHAFQNLKFYKAIHSASEIFGYKVSLSLTEYRALFAAGKIRRDVLEQVITDRKGSAQRSQWLEKTLTTGYGGAPAPRIGALRSNWKKGYRTDLDALVHPLLFRILCSYLDQGIAIWSFPVRDKSFLSAIREMEQNTFTSFFRTRRAKELLLKSSCEIADLLAILVGDELLYKQYLFDQQFAHQGWSGMVSTVEDQPQTLLDQRKMSMHDLVVFELLLEIDALDAQLGKNWLPLSSHLTERPPDLFAEVAETELDQVLTIWQDAFEWSYYDEVLAGIELEKRTPVPAGPKSFQALFCIDDRECSFRRYTEHIDPTCETFGTPGFFNVEFFFQPEDGLFYDKVCPVPVTPKFLIKEVGKKSKRGQDLNFSKGGQSFHSGYLISQTLGFWSAFRLALTVFRPTMSPAAASSFRHMDKFAKLTIENTRPDNIENNLQIGFTIDEMVQRVEGLLKSIGLIRDFAPIVYMIGHGSSSVNNPHYAAYDCGACAGRAGSVNARVVSYMANHPKVRETLATRGIVIPAETQFIGGLHDTTRDDIVFFDDDLLTPGNAERHSKNEVTFHQALDLNAKERSRRFASIDSHQTPEKIHEAIRTRSVSLFEPRPELNHATNALCIIGQRSLSKGLFLDRRPFLNSYDYSIDANGQLLGSILGAATSVCGGVNLEYYFSRVDNQKLGAGTKLPHNVMGLFGVANGIDGDLRPGLPSQMIEIHDPVRMLFIVEHFPDVVLETIRRLDTTYEWFINEWVNLVVVHPETRGLFRFKDGAFSRYEPLTKHLDAVSDVVPLLESTLDNLPVYLLD